MGLFKKHHHHHHHHSDQQPADKHSSAGLDSPVSGRSRNVAPSATPSTQHVQCEVHRTVAHANTHVRMIEIQQPTASRHVDVDWAVNTKAPFEEAHNRSATTSTASSATGSPRIHRRRSWVSRLVTSDL
ncbi:uncharacterized protein MONBRDRAFT_12528 [Monosiga brevicollis MX1]|uniref:Uncharacterized protein n=1 Tax=Monosiga brevicollis TaxID=81824 RepID=A9VCJ7_MONBE|nr:uncharacterized protein MONBRDRAFT_12528 [Monosiga brevicollis MX1]EDQ84761.1 predicted protein [Monosiga brevicollis MX1]|eukprot:XP_001750411.1 hypothetical protein [Monosiga brevicollis MX1]